MTTGKYNNNSQHKDRAYNLFNEIMSICQADDLSSLIKHLELFINEKNVTVNGSHLVTEDLYIATMDELLAMERIKTTLTMFRNLSKHHNENNVLQISGSVFSNSMSGLILELDTVLSGLFCINPSNGIRNIIFQTVES